MYGPPQFDPNGPQFQGGAGMAPPQGPQPPMTPPQPQQVQPQVPQTMGGVAQGAGVVQPQTDPDDLMNEYMQAKQVTDRVFAAAKQPMAQPQNHGLGWMLGNALSFGMVGLAEHDFNQKHNLLIQKQNNDVDMASAKAAFDLVNDKQKIAQLGTQQSLAALGLQLKVMALQEQKRRNDLTFLAKQAGVGTMGAPTPGQTEVLDALGYQPTYTGRGKGFEISPKAGVGPGPAPGSPLAGAMGSPADQIAQNRQDQAVNKAQALQDVKNNAPTESTRTMMQTAPKVRGLLDRAESNLKKIEAGPAASRLQEFVSGKGGFDNPDWMRFREDMGLVQTMLLRMHVGARGGQQMLEKFQDLLNYKIQSPANLRALIDETRQYATMVESGHIPEEGSQPTQPTGRTRTLSSGRVITEE